MTTIPLELTGDFNLDFTKGYTPSMIISDKLEGTFAAICIGRVGGKFKSKNKSGYKIKPCYCIINTKLGIETKTKYLWGGDCYYYNGSSLPLPTPRTTKKETILFKDYLSDKTVNSNYIKNKVFFKIQDKDLILIDALTINDLIGEDFK